MPAIAHKFITDQQGQPQEVVISLEAFRHIQEVLGADLDDNEETALRKAIQDSVSGDRSAFVSIDEI
jgi:hypothetical protein